MKKFKKVLIILIILILSGCTVDANITMSNDGKVKEEVSVLIESSLISNKKERIDSYVKTGLDTFKPALSVRNYKYEIINNPKTNSGAMVYNNYDNMCDFITNTVFSQYVYKKIDCTETDDFYEIKSESDHIPYCENCIDFPEIDSINLTFNLPIRASENNADEVNNNSYVWKFDKYTSNDKSIYLKINKNMLKENKIKSDKIEKRNSLIFKISVIVILLIIITVVSKILYKKYKSNKLDY